MTEALFLQFQSAQAGVLRMAHDALNFVVAARQGQPPPKDFVAQLVRLLNDLTRMVEQNYEMWLSADAEIEAGRIRYKPTGRSMIQGSIKLYNDAIMLNNLCSQLAAADPVSDEDWPSVMRLRAAVVEHRKATAEALASFEQLACVWSATEALRLDAAPVRISLSAFLHSLLTIAQNAFRYPLHTSVVDLLTGRTIARQSPSGEWSFFNGGTAEDIEDLVLA